MTALGAQRGTSSCARACRDLPSLTRGVVHLWLVDWTSLVPPDATLGDLLTADERRRAASFHFAADRHRFVTGRALLRQALGAYADREPRQIGFRRTAHGKLSMDDAAGWRVRFNLSHSGDLVLLGVTREVEIGVDVERERPIADFRGVACSCFSAEERQAIFQDPSQAETRFFAHWTAKEAWMKADGRGLALPLIEHTLRPSSVPGAYVLHNARGPVADWHIQTVAVPAGYAAAIAVGGERPACVEWIDVTSVIGMELRARRGARPV